MSNDLVDLYDRDPLSLSDIDIDQIILRQREAFQNYSAGNKPPPKPKKEKDTKGANDLLTELGL